MECPCFLARQEKPKSNTMFGLGFLFCLFAVGVDGGLCRERLLTRAGSVIGCSAKRQQKSPSFEEQKNYAIVQAKV